MKLLVSTVWEKIAAVGCSTDTITSAGILDPMDENDLDTFPAKLAELLAKMKNENERMLEEKSGRRCRISLKLLSHSITKL
ncbi:MAG: hypothetical protein WC289_05925 [Patescibacteria group bacterium]|jgi:hypothetical protein